MDVFRKIYGQPPDLLLTQIKKVSLYYMLYESTTTRHFTHHLYDVSTTIFWRALEGGAGGNQD